MNKDSIITDFTTESRKILHKCDIEASTSTKYCHDIDWKNYNDFWGKEIENKIHKVEVVFEILEEKDKVHCR